MDNGIYVPKKLKIELSNDPATPSQEIKPSCHKHICTAMFIKAIVTITKTETTWVSISGLMDKETVTQRYV